ncbi:MAG TPA: molybdopterin-guanine dinucleotide biosynthesis protein B [Longimicrobiales bacterium]
MTGQPLIVSIVGKKKSGKTTTLVRLAAELSRRGRQVATIKHSHGFTMDHEGRDSWRHRHEGGAIRTVVASEDEFAVLGKWPRGKPLDAIDLASTFLSDADIVLVEGYHSSDVPTIEVYQRAKHARLWYEQASAHRYLAIVSDDASIPAACPVLDLHDAAVIGRLADIIEATSGTWSQR